MARKILSVALYVLAGFFLYMGSVLAFVSGVPASGKWGMVVVVMVIAAAALVGGLVLARFRDWKRHAGIVSLAARVSRFSSSSRSHAWL